MLVLGISGGPDSLYLMHALHGLGCLMVAVHVNHRLRPESDQEEVKVKQFADHLGITLRICRVDVMTYAKEESFSLEEAGRILRYRTLFEQAKNIGASAVVVGHNADDQVETVLMHILRGAGLAGLRGMGFYNLPNPWSENIPLIRPLLTTWRSEIQEYLDVHQIKAITDPSNQDVSFFRNRLRHELLPTLEEYNPNIRQVLARMSLSLNDDYSILDELTDSAWESILIKEARGNFVFKTNEFKQLPLAIKRYFLRKAITYHLPGLSNVDFNCIERGLALLSSEKQNSQTDLIAGLRLIKRGSQFWITTWQEDLQAGVYPAISMNAEIIIQVPSILILINEWQVETLEITKPISEILEDEANLDPYQAWLDSNQLVSPLYMRVRRPGDQIKILGLHGHSVKVSDLMINLKLPTQARATWPLICSGSEIVWIPGCRISEDVKVNEDTSRVIHLRLFRNQAA